MATLYITEFSDVSATQGVTITKQPPVAEQTVAIGVGSTQSAAFNQRTRYIRLEPDSVCSIAISANPTAAATNMRLAAGQEFITDVPQGNKVAVIQNT